MVMFKRFAKYIFSRLELSERRVLEQIFHSLSSSHSITLIDIGAADDIQPRWKKIEKNLDYIGFEPDKRSLKGLSKKQPNQTKSYRIYPFGIWDAEASLNLYLCKKPQVSSAFRPNKEFLNRFPNADRLNVEKIEKIKCKSLDETRISICDFIKIDVQGGELNVLKGAKNTLPLCIGLEVEVEFLELYKEQPLFGEICENLTQEGFEFFDFVNLYRWERESFSDLGQLVFADALFLRSPEWIINNANEHQLLSYLKVCILYQRFDILDFLIKNLSLDKKIHIDRFNKNIKILKKKIKRSNNWVKFVTLFMKLNGRDSRAHLIY